MAHTSPIAVVLAAIDRVTAACKRADMRMGIFGLSGDSIQAYASSGYSLLLTGVDSILLGQAAKNLADSVRLL